MTSSKTIKLWFSDFWRPSTVETIQRFRLYNLLAGNWNIVLSPDQPDFLIYSCFGFEYLRYDCIRIFYTGENVRPQFDRCDYAFSFDYPITERNYRLPLYRLDVTYNQLSKPRIPDKVILEERKFCSLLSSNPRAKERTEFFELLSQYKRIDSGGKDRNNIGFSVADKMSWLQNYKFSIAFENSQYPGYTTEKLLHALVANTIPIYWGNPLVGKDFNPKAFINCHEYESFEDVVRLVKKIDQDDALYYEYLNQPFLYAVENEYRREENILTRFDQIFTIRRVFIPRHMKKAQILLYFLFRLRCLLNRSVNQIYQFSVKGLHKNNDRK